MNTLIESGYLNFLKSKLRSRIEFLERYTMVFPELILDQDLNFLRTIYLKETEIGKLLQVQERIAEIENHIESVLKSFSPENTKERI